MKYQFFQELDIEMIPEMFMLLGFLFIVAGLILGFMMASGQVLLVMIGLGAVLFFIGVIGYLKTRKTAYDEFHGER